MHRRRSPRLFHGAFDSQLVQSSRLCSLAMDSLVVMPLCGLLRRHCRLPLVALVRPCESEIVLLCCVTCVLSAAHLYPCEPLSAMDAERGALLAWMSTIYSRRDAKNFKEPKPYLPNLPLLGRLLSKSWKFDWTDGCNREVFLLGKASGYPFSSFLADLELPISPYGSCSANPICLDTTTEEWSLDDSETESSGNTTLVPTGFLALMGSEIPTSPVQEGAAVAPGSEPPSHEGVHATHADVAVLPGANGHVLVGEGGQMVVVDAALDRLGGSDLVLLPLAKSGGAMVEVSAMSSTAFSQVPAPAGRGSPTVLVTPVRKWSTRQASCHGNVGRGAFKRKADALRGDEVCDVGACSTEAVQGSFGESETSRGDGVGNWNAVN